MGSFGVLGLGLFGARLIGVEISMVVGVLWGDWSRDCGDRIGLIEVAQRVGVVGFWLVGRG